MFEIFQDSFTTRENKVWKYNTCEESYISHIYLHKTWNKGGQTHTDSLFFFFFPIFLVAFTCLVSRQELQLLLWIQRLMKKNKACLLGVFLVVFCLFVLFCSVVFLVFFCFFFNSFSTDSQ